MEGACRGWRRALEASCALLLFSMVSILCRVEFCKATGEAAEGPSFYARQVEKAARLQQQRRAQQPMYTIAKAPSVKQEYTEKTQHEQEMILIEKLWHRDHISSPWRVEGLSEQERSSAMLKRGEARVQAMIQRQNDTEFDDDASLQVTLSSSNTAQYFLKLNVGSDDHPNTVFMDTGSDLTWIQCEPCINCYKQTGTPQIFYPGGSSSLRLVSCSSFLCKDPIFSRGCIHDKCSFQLKYGDGSQARGWLMQDTFYLGGYHLPQVFFGCTHYTNGYFNPNGSGILGLGAGRYSLSTLHNMNVFFCLPGWQSNSIPGFVGLEPTSSVPDLPANTIYTKLLSSRKMRNGYFVNITGISINEVHLPISENRFALQSDGSGGLMVDSGTMLTLLQPDLLKIFRDVFRAAASNLQEWKWQQLGYVPKLLCFQIPGGPNDANTPTIRIHFVDASISLPPENVLANFKGHPERYCLAFSDASGMPCNLLGSVSLSGFLVYIDHAASTVGFAPSQCN